MLVHYVNICCFKSQDTLNPNNNNSEFDKNQKISKFSRFSRFSTINNINLVKMERKTLENPSLFNPQYDVISESEFGIEDDDNRMLFGSMYFTLLFYSQPKIYESKFSMYSIFETNALLDNMEDKNPCFEPQVVKSQQK